MPALRPAPLSVLVLAVVAAAPAGAGAATLSGEVTDPVDSAGSPGQDVTRISSNYDPDAGTWTEAIRFRGPLTTDDKAMLYSTLAACGSGTPGSPAPPVLNPASMQTWTDPADDSVGAFVTGIIGGVPTWGPASIPATKKVSDDGRTLTLTLTDPLLVDRDVCFVSPFRLSAFGTVYDRIAMIELKPAAVRGRRRRAGGSGRAGRRSGPGLRRPDRDDLPQSRGTSPRAAAPDRLTPLGAGTGDCRRAPSRRWPRARERPLPIIRSRGKREGATAACPRRPARDRPSWPASRHHPRHADRRRRKHRHEHPPRRAASHALSRGPPAGRR